MEEPQNHGLLNSLALDDLGLPSLGEPQTYDMRYRLHIYIINNYGGFHKWRYPPIIHFNGIYFGVALKETPILDVIPTRGWASGPFGASQRSGLVLGIWPECGPRKLCPGSRGGEDVLMAYCRCFAAWDVSTHSSHSSLHFTQVAIFLDILEGVWRFGNNF